MVQRNQKLFVIMCLSLALILVLYRIFSLRSDMACHMFTMKESDPRLTTMNNFGCNINLLIGTRVDEFYLTMKRHRTRNGQGNIKTYSVSDSYGKFGVNESLSCWEDSKFRDTFEENSQFIQNYPFGFSDSYLRELGLAGDFVDSPNPKIPVFVTAASSNHFLELQAQMQNLHTVVFPHYTNLKFIFYDIGLNDTEKEMVKKHCRCEYRLFPFETYPEHVKILKGYTFKPLIVQVVLNEYGFVLWMDASVRFQTGKLDTLFDSVIKDGVKVIEGGLGVGYRTDPVTFKFLGEDPCLFADKNEIQATFFIIYRTRVTFEAIMRPWVSCALTSGCMYFVGSQDRISCVNEKGLGFCHRFDQSIMSIILWRLYHSDFGRVHIPANIYAVQRDNTARYFESLEKKRHLYLV